MSQTETLLLVALGFALAALIALFLGRFVWAMGLRLGARRMQKQVPSTLVGLQTERDRLRAEYAMLSHRLGARMDAAKLQMAEQMAEVSRHRNRLETAEAELERRAAEIESLTGKIEGLEAKSARQASLNASLENAIAERDAELATVRDELAAARNELDELNQSLATVEILPPEDLAEVPAAEDGLKQRIERLTRMAHAVARERSLEEAGTEVAADPLLAEKLGDADRQTADIQKELEELDAEWSKRLGELQSQGQSPDTGDQQVAAPRGVANVISLANRIRALHKDVSNS